MLTPLQKELVKLSAEGLENGWDAAAEFVITSVVSNTPQKFEPSVTHPTLQGMVDAVRGVLFPNWPRHEGRNLVQAIKLHRTLTGSGLKDSKDWVEGTFQVGYKYEQGII